MFNHIIVKHTLYEIYIIIATILYSVRSVTTICIFECFINLYFTDPPTIQKGPSLIKSPVGSEAVFSCISNGVPPPEISWRKEGSSLLLSNTPSVTLEKTSIRLSNVRLQDSGVYVCTATNEAGIDRKEFNFQVTGMCCKIFKKLFINCIIQTHVFNILY